MGRVRPESRTHKTIWRAVLREELRQERARQGQHIHLHTSARCVLGRRLGEPDHLINLVARASTDGAMVNPSASAALRLTTSSKVFGATIGRSPGFAPLKIRSAYSANVWASSDVP